MDSETENNYVERVNELAAAVLADSRVRARRFSDQRTARLDLSSEELRKYHIAHVIEYKLGRRKTGFENDCHLELQKRFNLPIGSFAIPLDVLESRTLSSNQLITTSAPQALSFIEILRSQSVAYRLGVQRLTDLKNNVSIPRQITDATLAWMTTAGSVTASESSYGQVSATPRTAVAITEVTEQLLQQASADRIIMAGLAGVVTAGIDLAIISGTGAEQPLGILNTPGIGTLAGTSLAYTGVVGVQKTVADANAIVNPQALGYATTPTVAELLKGRQRFTGTDSPLWRGALHEGEIEGVKAVASKQMPTATMLYGDWSTVYVGEWGPLLLSVDGSGTRFNQGCIGIRALWMVDVIETAPSAFVKVASIT